ncbi:MAG: glycine cleavage system protein H [Planctomycetaceae bacterium]|nr:glycine cleavage system protein H [Planctomycetaceae bacterium]
MSEPLVFMMGQYKAVIPADRMYSRRHMWLQEQSDGIFRVGFTSYSVRLLQDVYFLEWSIDPQTNVGDRQEIGEIESSKAVSALYTPCAGTILEFNEALLNDPSGINADNYGSGWLYSIRPQGPLITAEEYVRVLADGWQETQRTIKGQMNQD